MITTSTQRVDYDATFRIESVSKTGHKVIIYSKGYKLKSWLDFEKSMGYAAEYFPVSEEEYEKHQWYNIPFDDGKPPKAEKKSKEVKKPVAKKTSKAAKSASKKTPVKKTVAKKTVVKKPADKLRKKK